MHRKLVCVVVMVSVFVFISAAWEPNSYHVWVFHRGRLSNDETKGADAVYRSSTQYSPFGHFQFRVIDRTAELSGAAADAWEQVAAADGTGPGPGEAGSESVIAVQYVDRLQENGTDGERSARAEIVSGPPRLVWWGRLGSGSLRDIFESPVRTEIRKRFVEDGSRIVWLLLKCGTPSADSAAKNRLNEFIRERRDRPVFFTLSDVNGRTARTGEAAVVTARRADVEERLLTAVLLGSEPHLAEVPEQPVVFPLFLYEGRVHALYSIVGDGINAHTLTEAEITIVSESFGTTTCTPAGCGVQSEGVTLLVDVR